MAKLATSFDKPVKSLPRNREKHAGQHIGVFLQPAADRFWDVLNQRNYHTPWVLLFRDDIIPA